MDISNRTSRPVSVDNLPNQTGGHQVNTTRSRGRGGIPFGRLAQALVLVFAALAIAGIVALLVLSDSKKEAQFIKEDKFQAVFLNDANGQVYFGRLRVVNDKVYSLTDIYYVRVQQVQPDEGETQAQQNISLAKLGNELHAPEDVMFIARDKVLFWENLKDDGQVVKAIQQYKENPDAANQQQQNNANENADTSEEE